MNPAPDADLHSVGKPNFEWIVREVADLAIEKAKAAPLLPELRWSAFLGGEPAMTKKPVIEKSAPKKGAPLKPKKAAAKSGPPKTS
jgi:hypothetical protein